ncbi:MAG: glycosyltransferase family 9 protein, partial [Anaerolineae bacterium]
WRSEAFAQVADALVERWQARIVLTGSRDDLDLVWSIYAHMCSDPIIAAGDTTIGQLAALFQRSRLVIGPDCGPLHLAVAMGTPTVHLYGPVDRRKFGPWGQPERHLVLTSGRACIPCNRLDYTADELPNHPCVREITPAAVLDTAQKLLAMK